VHYHSLQRDKISTIGALSVSPKGKHLALYLQFHRRNLNGLEVKAFLGELLKHLRGEIILWWDRSPIHIKRKEVSEFLRQHPRMGALPVFSRIEALITREDLVKGVIVESTTQSEHFVAVDDIPPRARAFHSHMADEFMGRFNAP